MCQKIGCIVKQQGNQVRCLKLTCRSWACDQCAVMRRNELVREAKEGMPERFITLTVNPHWFSSPEERAAKLVWAWRTIRRRFQKEHPNAKIEFMAVLEATKLGEPHLHICQRGAYMRQAWISAQMRELMGAPVVDISMIRSKKKVAEYVSKYISKKPVRFGSLKRYWRTPKWLTVSRAEKKRRRNAGARFYLLDWHWKGYMRWVDETCHARLIEVGRSSFSFVWPDDEPPPICVTVEPMGGLKAAA